MVGLHKSHKWDKLRTFPTEIKVVAETEKGKAPIITVSGCDRVIVVPKQIVVSNKLRFPGNKIFLTPLLIVKDNLIRIIDRLDH